MTSKTSLMLQICAAPEDSRDLIRSLRKNRDLLLKLGILVPLPKSYPAKLDKLANTYHGDLAPESDRRGLWALQSDNTLDQHTFLSHPTLIGTDQEVLIDGVFLPRATERPTWIRRSFGDGVELSFMLSLSNPARLINSAYARAPSEPFLAEIQNIAPWSVSWLAVIQQLRAQNPDTPIVLWQREETPFVWPALMHAAAGLENPVMIAGITDAMGKILRPGVVAQLDAMLEKNNTYDPAFLTSIFDKFLEKFSRPEAMSETIEIPGWTATTVETLTRLYAKDLELIRQIDGVTFLTG